MSADTGPQETLLERDGELRQLRRVMAAAARGDGSLTVLAAEAGLGKSRLLEYAVEEAAGAGLRPLSARSSELEGEFAFGIARQLLEPAVLPASEPERGRMLAGAAAHARAALGLDEDGGADRDVHAIVHGLYWLLANLAADTPLLVAVDDLQWADQPSLRWLAYAARRLEGLPIALVTSIRLDASAADPAPPDGRRAILDAICDHTPALRLEPGPLSAAGAGALIERRLGRAGAPEFVAACLTHTAGNPFLLGELIDELDAQNVSPDAHHAKRLAAIVPQRAGEMINRHLARQGSDARALATALAVLGDGGDLPLAASLAGLEPHVAEAAATELMAARIIADALPLRFCHPLLQAAVYAGAPAAERGGHHARAARLLAERDAPTARVAAQLIAATPGAGDLWIVDQLRLAARADRSRGAPEHAAALLRRALAEPPPAGRRGAVLHELGIAELRSADPGAADTLAAALDLASGPALRAEIGHALGVAHYLSGRHHESVDVLAAVIEEVAAVPELREQRLMLEAMLATSGRYDLQTQTRVGNRIHDVARRLTGVTLGERAVLSIAAGRAPGPSAADLFEVAQLEAAAIGVLPVPDLTEGIGTTAMYLHAGRPDAAAEHVERMFAGARQSGSQPRYGIVLAAHALVALDVGDLPVADDELDEALAILGEAGADLLARTLAAYKVQALVQRGRLAGVDALLAAHGAGEEIPELMLFNPLLFCRGEARLAQGRFGLAEADFRELGRRHELWGMTRPTPPWRSGCALALIGLGDPEQARALAAEELELVRRWNTPKAIAYTIRAMALALDHAPAAVELAEAVRMLEGTPWRFDLARARLDLGSALRRAGSRRDAREALTRAMDEAHACGADALAETAADELRASGARPRRRAVTGVDALTPSEQRVAGLAGDGLTNREIAQQLFVTMATVETHLTRVYRKLDLAGREGIAAALERP